MDAGLLLVGMKSRKGIEIVRPFLEGVRAVFRCALDNALAVLAGQRPAYVVNPEVYDKPLRTG